MNGLDDYELQNAPFKQDEIVWKRQVHGKQAPIEGERVFDGQSAIVHSQQQFSLASNIADHQLEKHPKHKRFIAVSYGFQIVTGLMETECQARRDAIYYWHQHYSYYLP
jgi:pantoate kinase